MTDTTTRGRVRIEEGHKRVRAYLGGELVADTLEPKLEWEIPYFPTYFFPAADVRTELLTESGTVDHSPSRGEATGFNVSTARSVATDAAWQYRDSPIEGLAGLIKLDWPAMDEWFEEDERVYVHPRDPYTRVDILASSRHVQVIIDGVTVADSHQPRLLFETGLPTRYYLPLTDVRMDLLRPSKTVSHCPYKGTATYWSIEVDGTLHEDAVWTYEAPLPESQKVIGLVAFYNEHVDLVLDGVPLERPRTHFS